MRARRKRQIPEWEPVQQGFSFRQLPGGVPPPPTLLLCSGAVPSSPSPTPCSCLRHLRGPTGAGPPHIRCGSPVRRAFLSDVGSAGLQDEEEEEEGGTALRLPLRGGEGRHDYRHSPTPPLCALGGGRQDGAPKSPFPLALAAGGGLLSLAPSAAARPGGRLKTQLPSCDGAEPPPVN